MCSGILSRDADPVRAAKHYEKERVQKQEARKTGEHAMRNVRAMCAWNYDTCMPRGARV